jgi:hypothetical protein
MENTGKARIVPNNKIRDFICDIRDIRGESIRGSILII